MSRAARISVRIPVGSASVSLLALKCRLDRGAVVVLIVSLLFAQFVGFLHRIEHAKWLGNQESIKLNSQAVGNFIFDSPPPSRFDDKKSTNHSCAAFDAATLADTLNTLDCGTAFPGNENSASYFVATSSWKAPVFHHYLSRAPPSGSI
jgi:hypothetical protein